jgi:FkbM family methyltransferase
MFKVYFQIGTNNGNDLFRDLVVRDMPDLVILVEPNSQLIDTIRNNYKNIKNVHIYSNAIYYTNDEPIELYVPAKNGIIGTQADNGIRYGDAHFSLLPMNDWGAKSDMAKIQTTSITFDKICSIHNITNIEYLQIDTEGFDSEIIKMIDFSKFIINTLRFESWGFKTSCFTSYSPELADTLGENGLINSIKKLEKHNYTVRSISDMDGNDIIATLIK